MSGIIIEAFGGKETLTFFVARNISVALSVADIVMPRVSGEELARRAQESSLPQGSPRMWFRFAGFSRQV
jgi:YesN/AraC family two-component response regulator